MNMILFLLPLWEIAQLQLAQKTVCRPIYVNNRESDIVRIYICLDNTYRSLSTCIRQSHDHPAEWPALPTGSYPREADRV